MPLTSDEYREVCRESDEHDQTEYYAGPVWPEQQLVREMRIFSSVQQDAISYHNWLVVKRVVQLPLFRSL